MENEETKTLEEKKPDIFDRIMTLPILRIFEPFYKAHKMPLLYLFFGGTAFFLNLFLFYAIGRFLKINPLVNNVICWVVCVLYQFWTNRTWVFDGKTEGALDFVKQMLLFFGGRLFTLFLEEAIIAVFITWLKLPEMPVKLAAQVIVIVLNYVISKVFVFKEKK
ncbi:MAG: GtrA family protein [Treponema sp.]|nr:GtrA family protein [Treponema sp.]